MSNFSFSHCVFKGLVLKTRKNQGLFGKGLKEFADDNSEFNDNGRKFSRGVENTMGEEEIAHYLL